MALPDDFEWKTPPGQPELPAVIGHRGVWVVQLRHWIDGGWQATLGRYWFPPAGVRVCTDYEKSRGGAEL